MPNTSIGNEKYPLKDAQLERDKPVRPDGEDDGLKTGNRDEEPQAKRTAEEVDGNSRMIKGTNNGQPDAVDPGDNGDAYTPDKD